jgi:hypothetical protein
MTDSSDSGFETDFETAPGDAVYESGDDDAEYLDSAETLTGDDYDEALDTSYSPPDREPAGVRYGMTADEQERGESLDYRLAQEEPEISEDDVDGAEDPRAGRLVAPDEGAHEDRESDAIGYDVGKAGSAASAEEAAMHIVSEDDIDRD